MAQAGKGCAEGADLKNTFGMPGSLSCSKNGAFQAQHPCPAPATQKAVKYMKMPAKTIFSTN